MILMVLYRVNAGYIPPDNWVHSEEGGGRIIGEACHMFDFFNFIVGSADVVEVCAQTVGSDSEHIHSSENTSVSVRYRDGSVCTLVYTSLGAKELPKEYVEIYCDGKAFVIDDFEELRVHGSKAEGWKGSQDKGHLRELEEFGRAVRDARSWPIPLNELVRATETSIIVNQGVQQ
ncbi:hypothetical protein CW706_04740 [Candidatus Bathyarchaeota archaeon]|nr:MAG: hypothetical protein CW706_04740 [Candidatus Bathyarchaeota archaeon]